MQKIKFFLLIYIALLTGCRQDEAIKIVEDFLSEPNPQNKLQYVRGNSDYLKNNSVSGMIEELPQNYIEIKRSKEIVDEKEIIVEVVTEKISVGGQIVDKRQEFFVFNDNGNYKIDLDASFVKRDTTIINMIKNKIKFTKELNVYVSGLPLKDEKFITNKKVLISLLDNMIDRNIYILDDSLFKKLESILSQNSLAHLILKVNYLLEENDYIVSDSLIQKGWIRNK